MARTTGREVKVENTMEVVEGPSTVSVHSLPLEVIYMIIEILKPNPQALRACSLAARGFRAIAQPLLGRHISVNEPSRVKYCVQLLKTYGFQHVTSLSLGIMTKRTVLEKYWSDYLAILKVFASRKSLVCLWFREIPFFLLQPRQKKVFKEAVLALSSSVTELGLYGCHFSCYEEMVSFVRAFPHCDKLSIRDCVTGGRGSPENSFAGFPQYKLSIVDLDITASSTHQFLIDPSGFIEDAELDVSSLYKLACDFRWVTGTRHIISATSKSPVCQLRFSSHYPGGFQVFVKSVSPGWRLESLAIGTMHDKANAEFWKVALKNFPKLPHLTKVQITYDYRTPRSRNIFCWGSFASILSNRKTFPRLETVDTYLMYRSQRLGYWDSAELLAPLKSLKSSGIKVMCFGQRLVF